MVQTKPETANASVTPDAEVLARSRGELDELRGRRERLEAEAADVEVVLRGLLAVRRAAEAGITPELARLQEQVEQLIDRARHATHSVAAFHGWIDRVVAAGHGDLVEATPALTRALHREQERRHRFHDFVREHLPPAAFGVQPDQRVEDNDAKGAADGQG